MNFAELGAIDTGAVRGVDVTEGPFALENLLFDWLPFPAVIHDRDTVYDVNREVVRRLKGDTAEQFIGHPINDFVHPHVLEAAEARREMIEKGLHFRGVTTKLIALDGEEMAFTGCALPFRVGQRDLALSIAINLDCSERVYGAAQGPHGYPDGHSYRAAALETVPAGVVALRGLEIAYVNPACARLMRMDSAESLVGRSVLDFVDAMMLETLRERFTVGIMNATVDKDSPGKIHAGDGSVIDIITRGQMIEGGENALRIWTITAADVSGEIAELQREGG